MISGTTYLAMTWGPTALIGILAVILIIRRCDLSMGRNTKSVIDPRKIVYVVGEPKVGKTTMINQYLNAKPGRRRVTAVIVQKDGVDVNQEIEAANQADMDRIFVEISPNLVSIDPKNFKYRGTWVVLEYDNTSTEYVEEWRDCVRRIDQHASPMSYHILMFDGDQRMEDEKIQECFESIFTSN